MLRTDRSEESPCLMRLDEYLLLRLATTTANFLNHFVLETGRLLPFSQLPPTQPSLVTSEHNRRTQSGQRPEDFHSTASHYPMPLGAYT